MGLDSFKDGSNSEESNDVLACNRDGSEVNRYGKGGKYDEENVLDIMVQCNLETSGDKISRSKYKSWKDTVDFDCPSSSWFYRNGGWNEWLTKAGIGHNSRGTRISFDGIEQMSPSKAYTIGVLMADGSVTTNKGQHKIQLSTIDQSFIDMFCNRLCEFTGLDRSSITEGRSDNQYYATKMSKDLALEMDKYTPKTWTKWVDELTEKEVLYLVSGLYDSEGHYNKDESKCIFNTTSISMKNLFVWCLTEYLLDSTSVNEIRRKSIDYHEFSIQEYFREDRSSIEYQIILSEQFSEEFIDMISCSITRKLGDSE